MFYLNKIAAIIFWSFFVWLVSHIFILQIALVPTFSMQNTLQVNDYILINKWSYGARFPITLLSLPFNNKYIYVGVIFQL